MQLGFIGFGLIAGSIARAVRANPKTARLEDGGLVAIRERAVAGA